MIIAPVAEQNFNLFSYRFKNTNKGVISIKQMKKILTLSVIVVLVIAVAFFAGMSVMKHRSETKITSSFLINKLETAKELTTLKYQYTNIGQFENQNTFYGYAIPFTEKHFFVSYEGTIHAGVDLSEIQAEVKGKSITITLPKAKILSHEINEDSLKIYNEKTSIFNPIRVEDYADFSRDQKSKMEEEALKKGLLNTAQKDAEKAVKEILQVDSLLKDYTVTVTSEK